jgi:cobalt-zinc-cadmium efflux system membrane fusion protein
LRSKEIAIAALTGVWLRRRLVWKVAVLGLQEKTEGTEVALEAAAKTKRGFVRPTAVLVLVALAVFIVAWIVGVGRNGPTTATALPQPTRDTGIFRPSETQWATLSIGEVKSEVFRAEHVTEGKIAVDEDRATPVFSPFAGRISKLLVGPGDKVEVGQPLFIVEAADSVQTQNDFIAALAAFNKATTQLKLAQSVERRLHDLFDAKAIAQKDWQQAQADAAAAENDLRSARTALEAARNRLRLIGKSEAEIDNFRATGIVSSSATVYAPIAGTVVQRKAGPGQYINAGSTDPVFIVGDVGHVWLVAYVREADAPKIEVGQTIRFSVLSDASRVREAKLSYVATNLDPTTRRLLVRATVDNTDGKLKPEMFANASILIGDDESSPAVPRSAIIYEGETAKVWAVGEGRSLVLKTVKTGLVQEKLIQVLNGLKPGDQVVTRGSLFIDKAAGAS